MLFHAYIFRKESRKAGERLEERALTYEEKVDEIMAKLDEIEKKMIQFFSQSVEEEQMLQELVRIMRSKKA